jgi:chitin-binding protein
MNHGTAAYSRWQVGWTLPAGQTVGSVWNGTLSQSGSAVTVRNADWNGTIAADGQTTFGLVVNTTGGAAAPSPTAQGSLASTVDTWMAARPRRAAFTPSRARCCRG